MIILPNANYLRGYRVELLAKKELEKEGYYVVRSAGSHSLFDLIAFDNYDFRLIQLKSFSGKKKAPKFKWDEAARNVGVPENCRKEIWVYKSREGFIKKDEIRS